jgi:hypothetical protein
MQKRGEASRLALSLLRFVLEFIFQLVVNDLLKKTRPKEGDSLSMLLRNCAYNTRL